MSPVQRGNAFIAVYFGLTLLEEMVSSIIFYTSSLKPMEAFMGELLILLTCQVQVTWKQTVILNKTLWIIQITGGYFQGQTCTHSRSTLVQLHRFVAALGVKSRRFQTAVCHSCRLRLCGQDTCPLCLLSGRLSMPVSNTLVTHTICSLQHSWLGQTWLGVGNGAYATCDLDTVSYVRS